MEQVRYQEDYSFLSCLHKHFHDSIRDISPTLPYYQDIIVFHEELIACAYHTPPNYAEDNRMVLEVLFRLFQGINHIISVNPFVRKYNVRGALLVLYQHNTGSSKWDTIVDKA